MKARIPGDSETHLWRLTPRGLRCSPHVDTIARAEDDPADPSLVIRTLNLSPSTEKALCEALEKGMSGRYQVLTEGSGFSSEARHAGTGNEIVFLGQCPQGDEDSYLVELASRESARVPVFLVISDPENGSPIGVLPGGTYECFLESEIHAEALIPAIKSALEIKALEKDMQQFSGAPTWKANDKVTGLMSQTVAEDFLGSEIRRVKRANQDLVCVVVRLETYPDFVEEFGNACEHLVLKEAARRLRTRVRHGDVLARLEGTDFLVVLPGISAERAFQRAGQITAVLARPFDLFGTLVKVPVQTGIASLKGTGAGEPRTLIEHALLDLSPWEFSETGSADAPDVPPHA